jgi:hypothetical protein
VNSFVGAIALGWLFAQGILHFAYVFSSPVANWLTRREWRGVEGRVPTGFSLQDGLPELIRSISLLLVAYFLLRWLYYKSLEPERTESHQEQSA